MTLTKAIRASMLAGLIATPFSTAMADIQWNGFLSVGGGMTFDDDETFAGYDNDLSFAPDSILGLQASSDLGENLSVTGQLVARGDTSEVKAEWLYLSYQLNPNLRINVGRQRMPLFLYSDYVDVGYAYHFQRPPTSVYMSPINSVDSVSLLYKRFVGPLETALHAWGGSYKENDVEFEGQILDLEITDNVGASLTLVYNDWLTVRGIYSQAKTTITGEGYARVAGLGQLAQSVGNHKVAKAMNGEEVGNTFAGLSISAELNDYLFVAEAIQQNLENTDQDTNAFYISAARRFGNFMPYITLERNEVHTNNDLYRDIQPTSSETTTLYNGLKAYMDANDRNEYLYSVGVRYDFHPSAALKVQYTHVDDQRDEQLMKNIPGMSKAGWSRDANLLSFSIDTVF